MVEHAIMCGKTSSISVSVLGPGLMLCNCLFVQFEDLSESSIKRFTVVTHIVEINEHSSNVTF